MRRLDASAPNAGTSAVLPVALWFGSAVAALGPGVLLLGFAESRLVSMASTALIVAGAVAAGSGVACVMRVMRPLLGASAVVVLLCLAALVLLDVDGRVTPGGVVLLGGTAAALAVLAGALTLRFVRRRGGR